MNFTESLEYLYKLGNEVIAMKLGLTSTEKLLAALGNPEKHFTKIQVAGTNGKGSTCAFLDAICRSAQIKTGLFTSPHLISITERIKIGGEEISEKDFARHATRVREIAEKLVAEKELEALPTFFEQMTAIGIAAFAEREIEMAILETGLGGRLDSVTATRAEIVAITPIDYDHQQILGNTLTEIAAEKAAIIRKDTTVFVSPQKQEAENVVYGKCLEVGVDPIWAIPNVKLIKDLGGGLLYLSFTTKENNYKVDFSMQGKHQWTNAALAICIAENLRDFNFKIAKENFENGLETDQHKGRLEFWIKACTSSILFDGAHNVAGARALRDYLDEFVKQPVTMIFGAMRDKDLPEIAETLFPKAKKLILTEPKNERAVKISELLKHVPGNFDQKKVMLAATVEEAITAAKRVTEESELILITGSLYLVGEAQEILKSAF
jgi:dihydrofolate synthase/folylpolyglutamate synthase